MPDKGAPSEASFRLSELTLTNLLKDLGRTQEIGETVWEAPLLLGAVNMGAAASLWLCFLVLFNVRIHWSPAWPFFRASVWWLPVRRACAALLKRLRAS